MAESNPTQVILTDDGIKIIKAQNTADNAKDLAGTADNNIKNINDPNYLSPFEKPQLKVQMDNFATIYAADKDIATSEGIDFTAYDAAYQAYLAYMTPLIADMTTHSPIVRSTFNGMVTAVQAEQKRFNAATQAQYNQQINKVKTDISDGQKKYEALHAAAEAMVKKGDVVNQFNLDAGGALLSTSGNSTKIVFSSPNIIFDSANPVQIPNANIPGTLTGKTFEAGTITATTKITGADIEAPLIHSPSGSFKLDGNTGDIVGASIHSADNSWGIDKNGNINGVTINVPTLDLGLNGKFTEDFDYTQSTSLFLPKKNKGTLTFNHGVLQSGGRMQTYVHGKWGGMNDNYTFQAGIDNSQGTEVAPGYIKLDLFKQNDTDVAERTYVDPTGFYYTNNSNHAYTSFVGNIVSTPQVQTASVVAKTIYPVGNRLEIDHSGSKIGLQVGSYAGKEAVLSDYIYDFTTSVSSNVYITSNGHLARSTSASKYKYNISNPDYEDVLGDRLLNVHLASWNDKNAIDSYAHTLNTGEDTEKMSIDKYHGLIAEQLRDAGLEMFVEYSEDGEIEGIQYDRAWIPLLAVVRRLNNKINEYEMRISNLEGKK